MQLTKKEINELKRIGKCIIADLSCNCNGDNFPCRTCRFAAMEHMEKYLSLG